MFKIVEKRRAWWPVTFAGVTEGGKVVQNKIEFRFLITDEDEHAELLAKVSKLEDGIVPILRGVADADEAAIEAATKPSETYAQIVALVADDWRGVGAENGDPLTFGTETLARLMKVPNVFMATMAGFRACRAAAPEIRKGN